MYFMGSSVNVRYFGGGVKCHLLNIGVKNANGWIVQGSKVYFLLNLLYSLRLRLVSRIHWLNPFQKIDICVVPL